MLLKQIAPLLILAATFSGSIMAKKDKNSPGPTCGAPFCDKKGVIMTGITFAMPSSAMVVTPLSTPTPTVTPKALRVGTRVIV
ncbi:hypothetical protein EK21DRAFT_115213 [Setomelanomma holmii]|uniref:Uncharacterized protein n=1 Tax=Setomelanomma holmii TaxID=210430 RepID=A0A9P4H5L2_9PLEO|nr:hypothetical protein EK21DRAFT_115213 [Setomelanomma holmii]